MKKYLTLTAYCVVAATIGAVLFLFTPLGLGETPDSIAYLKGAQGLLAGYGFSYMSGQWPPLYPTAIAATAFVVHQDVIVGARVLQALLFGSNFLLIACVLRRFSNASTLLALLAAGLLCLHPVMVHIHFYAWSEPLFIALMFANMLVLSQLVQKPFNLNWTLLLAVMSGFALLTRFVGIAVIAANCVVLVWIFWSLPRARRLAMLFIQVLIPLAMYVPWIGHKALSDSTATERWLSFTFPSLDLTAKALATMGTWLLPWQGLQYDPTRDVLTITLGIFLLFLPFGIAIGSNLLAVSRARHANQTIMASLTICYVGFVLTAWMLIDSKVHLDNRMLSPVLIVTFACIFYLLLKIKQKIICCLGIALFVLLLGSAYRSALGVALLSKYSGLELAAKELSIKPLNQFIRGCSKQARVFADLPWNIELYFSTKVSWLPAPTLYYKGIKNINYDAEITSLRKLADIIILQNIASETVQMIDQLDSFSRIYDKEDGIVWQNKSSVKAERCQ